MHVEPVAKLRLASLWREFAAFRRGTFDGPTAVWLSAAVLRASRSANGPDLTSITQQARSCHHNPPVVSMSRWPIQLTQGRARGIAQNGRRSRASPAQRPVPDTGDRRSPRGKRLVQRCAEDHPCITSIVAALRTPPPLPIADDRPVPRACKLLAVSAQQRLWRQVQTGLPPGTN
jgi:hypothetical protein